MKDVLGGLALFFLAFVALPWIAAAALAQPSAGGVLTAVATASVEHTFDVCGDGRTAFDGQADGAGDSGGSGLEIAAGTPVSATLTGADLAPFQGSSVLPLPVSAFATVETDSSSLSWTAAGTQRLVGASLVVTLIPVSGGPTTQVFSFGTEAENKAGGWAWVADVVRSKVPLSEVRLDLTAVGVLDASFETLEPDCHRANTTQTLDVFVLVEF